MAGHHSIRIPIHGFVELDDWEWDIVNHSAFQRLRRIRQLAFSEHVYPGATHTRFEHSLGVLHIATRLFDTLKAKHEAELRARYGYNFDAESFARSKRLVRLAALLHDVGHAPFSHSGEELMPRGPAGRFDHEDYTARLIEHEMKDVLDDHASNRERLAITGKEVADFYLGKPEIGNSLVWRELVSGQLDADRMDYLLRDSHHCGVSYGMYDLDRIIDTVAFVKDEREDTAGDLAIGIEEGGQHAAEGLILARYFMFTQVYFHETRLAYDYHASQALRSCLGERGQLPNPDNQRGRRRYLNLDDWSVYKHLRAGSADRHKRALLYHEHDRCIDKTDEVARPADLERHDEVLGMLRKEGIDAWEADASKSWYRTDRAEIQIGVRSAGGPIRSAEPLAQRSEVVGRIRDSKKRLIFVPQEQREQAKELIDGRIA